MIKLKRLRHLALTVTEMERQLADCRAIIGLAEIGHEAGRAFLASEARQLSILLEQGSVPDLARLVPAERCSDIARGCPVALRSGCFTGSTA